MIPHARTHNIYIYCQRYFALSQTAASPLLGSNRLPRPEKSLFDASQHSARPRWGVEVVAGGGWVTALLADRGWRFGRMDGSQTFYLSFAVPSDSALAPLIGQTPGRLGAGGARWLAGGSSPLFALTSRGQSVVSQARMNCAWKMFAKCNFSFISSNYISEQMLRSETFHTSECVWWIWESKVCSSGKVGRGKRPPKKNKHLK